MPEPPTTTTLAPIGTRALARLIDALLLVVVGALPVLAFADIRIDQGVFDSPAWIPWATWGAGLAYEVLFIALTGQTLGKRWLGIRVVDGTTGALPDLGQAGRRAFPTVLGRLPYLGVLASLCYLRALWHPRRQGVHDAVAGTIVVSLRAAP